MRFHTIKKLHLSQVLFHWILVKNKNFLFKCQNNLVYSSWFFYKLLQKWC